MKPNLTFNLGLRWEVSMPWYDTQGKIETIVPGVQSTQFPDRSDGLGGAGRSGHSQHAGADAVQQPRSAARDGLFAGLHGRHYEEDLRRSGKDQHPGGLRHLLHFDRGFESVLRSGRRAVRLVLDDARQPICSKSLIERAPTAVRKRSVPVHVPDSRQPREQDAGLLALSADPYSPGYDIHNRMPYAEHYNFSIQRELSNSTVLTLAYVGTQGHRLISQNDANPGNAALCKQLNAQGATDLSTGIRHARQRLAVRLRSTTHISFPTARCMAHARAGPAFGSGNTFTATAPTPITTRFRPRWNVRRRM